MTVPCVKNAGADDALYLRVSEKHSCWTDGFHDLQAIDEEEILNENAPTSKFRAVQI